MKKQLTTILFSIVMTFFTTGCGADQQPASTATASANLVKTTENDATASLEPQSIRKPKMLEFGSKQCKACKAMEPVMANLKESHSAIFDIDFIDVWIPENQIFAKSHNITSIPTQVFLDADGKEVFRNIGFFSEENILAKWSEIGIDVEIKATAVDDISHDAPTDDAGTEEAKNPTVKDEQEKKSE